jgi:Tfp pilus assembly protein PilP
MVLAVVVVAVAVELSREAGRAVAPVSSAPEKAPVPGMSPPPSPERPTATFSRDPFRFADDARVVPPAGRIPPAAVAPLPSPEPALARARLVGLVRRGGVLRAAVSVNGEVALVSAGETIGGFRVLSLDEERGVRVRDAEGVEATWAPAEGSP